MFFLGYSCSFFFLFFVSFFPLNKKGIKKINHHPIGFMGCSESSAVYAFPPVKIFGQWTQSAMWVPVMLANWDTSNLQFGRHSMGWVSCLNFLRKLVEEKFKYSMENDLSLTTIF